MKNLKITIITIVLIALFLLGEFLFAATYTVTTGANDGYQQRNNFGDAWHDDSTTGIAGCRRYNQDKLSISEDNSVGVIFSEVAVPQGYQITQATLTLVPVIITNDPELIIFAEDADTASSFAAASGFPDNVTRTTASEEWIPVAGTNVVTVTTIAQEVFDRADWVGGNDIKFVILDNISLDTNACTGAGLENNTTNIAMSENGSFADVILTINLDDNSVLIINGSGAEINGSSLEIQGL